MKKRVLFILFGAFFLVAGVSGLVLVQTDLFYRTPDRNVTGRIEPVPPTGTAGIPEQAGTEGKVPPGGQSQAETAGQAESLQSPPGASAPAPSNLTSKPPVEQVSPQPPSGSEQSTIPPVLKGPRRYPEQARPPQVQPEQGPVAKPRPGSGTAPARPGNYARAKPTNESSRQPISLRFSFKPGRQRDIRVARVHLGDRIVIKVRRVGRAERQIYLGFDLPGQAADRSYSNGERMARRSRAVITPVRDSDQLVLKAESRFGQALSSRLDSREGAVLRLGAKPARNSYDQGYYDIQMKIYPGNRWNIKPRSFQ